MSRPVALVTGASSGLGAEFATEFARRGYDVVVTARREERLAALAEKLRADVDVAVIAADLGTSDGCQSLLTELDDRGLAVDVLVNNAGAAHTGLFSEMEPGKALDIVDLNVRALVQLTEGLLPGMRERGRGHILNVASVVGFQAVPGMTAYSASKAFVLSFSEGLAEELVGSGVRVTALCPGLTKTEMVADLDVAQVPELLMADAGQVARDGVSAMKRGEVVHVPGIANQALVTWLGLQPRSIVRMLSGAVARATYR